MSRIRPGVSSSRAAGSNPEPITTATGLNHLSLGKNDGQTEDIVLGSSIFDGLNSGSVVGDHAADGRIRPRIRRKKESVFPGLTIQLFPKDTRFDIGLKVLGADLDNPVHPGHVHYQ